MIPFRRALAVMLAISMVTASLVSLQAEFRSSPEPLTAIGSTFESRAVSTPLLSVSSRWVAEGDSITAASVDQAWETYADSQTGGRFFRPQHWMQAIGGQTASQMTSQIAAIMAPLPALVTFMAGTNDLSGLSDSPVVIYNNILTCVLGYLTNDGTKVNGAKYVIVAPVLPRYGSNALPTTREADRKTLNGLIANLANDPTLSAYQGRVKVLPNLDASFPDATYFYENLATPGNGLHPNGRGAMVLGQAFAAAMSTVVDQTSKLTDLYLDASNLLVAAGANPALAGGPVAAGWSVASNGGITITPSLSTLNEAAALQRIVASGTSSGAGSVVNFSRSVSYSGKAGDAVEICIDYSLAAGYQNLIVLVLNGPTGSAPLNTASSQTVIDGSGALVGTLRTPVTTPLSGSAPIFSVQAYLVFKAGVVAADITWSRPYARKVPTGQ